MWYRSISGLHWRYRYPSSNGSTGHRNVRTVGLPSGAVTPGGDDGGDGLRAGSSCPGPSQSAAMSVTSRAVANRALTADLCTSNTSRRFARARHCRHFNGSWPRAGFLRGRWGFSGAVLTHMLPPQAPVRQECFVYCEVLPLGVPTPQRQGGGPHFPASGLTPSLRATLPVGLRRALTGRLHAGSGVSAIPRLSGNRPPDQSFTKAECSLRRGRR